MNNLNKNKSLHIALVFDGFDQGGIGKVNLTLANWFLNNGHSVDLIVFSENGPRKSQIPKCARVISLERSKKFKLLFKLWSYFLANNPEGVFVANGKTSIYVAIAKSLARKSSRVVGIHHTNMNTDFANQGNSLYKVSLKCLAWFATRFLGLQLAAVSEGAKSGLSKYTGINQRGIHVLYNPVFWDENTGGIPEDLKVWWSDGDIRLLTVGRLTPEKGYTTLFDALEILKKRANFRLMIVGSGPYESEIKRIVGEKSLENNVVLAGFHPNPRAFYEYADVFVLSSISEALPLTLVEAMSFGKQIVSTDCDFGPREILENGRWGKLVPVDDANALSQAIWEIISSPIPTTNLKTRAKEFSPENTINKYLDLIAN